MQAEGQQHGGGACGRGHAWAMGSLGAGSCHLLCIPRRQLLFRWSSRQPSLTPGSHFLKPIMKMTHLEPWWLSGREEEGETQHGACPFRNQMPGQARRQRGEQEPASARHTLLLSTLTQREGVLGSRTTGVMEVFVYHPWCWDPGPRSDYCPWC